MTHEKYEDWRMRLMNSERVTVANLELVPSKPGAYALWMERQGKCILLKVGIAGPRRKDGIRGRLCYHHRSNPTNTVFARHMSTDLELAQEVGYDFTQRWQRQKFLATFCFFKFIVIEDLNESELRSFESYLENRLQPRYKGEVGGPYQPVEFRSCP